MNWFDNFINTPKNSDEYGNIRYFTEDEFGKLFVIDYGDSRVLNFDSPFEQSCLSIKHPYKLVHQYTQSMLLVLAFIQPSNITLFGLGGGSILRTLHHMLPDCFFKVIELRQKVVDIAFEYFFIPSDDKRLDILVTDALEEIEKCEPNSTDIIFSDMYNAYHMIPEQVQKTFLKKCSRLLTNNGWLVINLHNLPKNQTGFYNVLLESFPTVIMSTNKVNTILYLSKSQPDCISTNFDTLESAEVILKQEFISLMNRLKPNNFARK